MTPTPPSNVYTCEVCGDTFQSTLSTEKAEAEALENWGIPHASTDPEMALVCHDCYQRIMKRFDCPQ